MPNSRLNLISNFQINCTQNNYFSLITCIKKCLAYHSVLLY